MDTDTVQVPRNASGDMVRLAFNTFDDYAKTAYGPVYYRVERNWKSGYQAAVLLNPLWVKYPNYNRDDVFPLADKAENSAVCSIHRMDILGNEFGSMAEAMKACMRHAATLSEAEVAAIFTYREPDPYWDGNM